MQSDNTISKPQLTEREIQQIIYTIEKKTEEQLMKGYKSNQVGNSSKFLLQIMQNGADEFEKKTGTKMSYSQMREMFG